MTLQVCMSMHMPALPESIPPSTPLSTVLGQMTHTNSPKIVPNNTAFVPTTEIPDVFMLVPLQTPSHPLDLAPEIKEDVTVATKLGTLNETALNIRASNATDKDRGTLPMNATIPAWRTGCIPVGTIIHMTTMMIRSASFPTCVSFLFKE